MLMQYVPLIFALAWAALIAKGLLTFDHAVKYAHGHLSFLDWSELDASGHNFICWQKDGNDAVVDDRIPGGWRVHRALCDVCE